MNESDNYFVSSRGLMKICDYFSNDIYSSIHFMKDYPPLNKIEKIRNPVIYVCNRAIRNFVDIILPTIHFKFVLVSGDSDDTMPFDIFYTDNEFNNFINNDKIIHWFSQNTNIIHPKITIIPIGLDYHTMTYNNMWGDIRSYYIQEKELRNIIDNSKPFWERNIKCYANFHFATGTKYGYDRLDAIAKINSELVYYEPTHINRVETWKKQIEYTFVISPHGNGLDCHRTWEALVLGCIPIVKTSNIDILYEDLPVVIVKDWNNITNEVLMHIVNEFRNRTFNYKKLTLNYWRDLFTKKRLE
jgi:hypothetical protein